MSRHRIPRQRPRIAVPALITAAAFSVLSAVAFAAPGLRTAEPDRISAPDAPLPAGKVLPAFGSQRGGIPVAPSEAPAAPSPAPSSAPAPKTSEHPSAVPTAEPSAKPRHKAEDRKRKKLPKSRLRRGLEQVVPGLDQLPDWSLPIVYKANKDKAPNTTVRVRIDERGNLIIRAKLLKGKKRPAGFSAVSLRTGPASVDVRIVVQDPTKATADAPTSITVTATDPVTESTVTTTAEVTAPAEVATVADTTVTETVQEAAETTDLGTPT